MFNKRMQTRIWLLGLLLLSWAWTSAMAQAKIGYTDPLLIVSNMPEYQNIQTQLQQELQAAETEFQQKTVNFQNEVQDYQSKQALMSADSRAAKEQELAGKQAQLQQELDTRRQGLAKREADLMQPLFDKVNEAIKAIAEQQGLTIVVTAEALLYANDDAVDITPMVATQVGIELADNSNGN